MKKNYLLLKLTFVLVGLIITYSNDLVSVSAQKSGCNTSQACTGWIWCTCGDSDCGGCYIPSGQGGCGTCQSRQAEENL